MKFDGNCSLCSKYGHKAGDCWWKDTPKDAAALEVTHTPKDAAALYHDDSVSGATLKALEAQWLFMMDYADSPEPEAHEFLIDSGAAVGVCPAWMAGKGRRGPGVSLV